LTPSFILLLPLFLILLMILILLLSALTICSLHLGGLGIFARAQDRASVDYAEWPNAGGPGTDGMKKNVTS
jgi:hypothetical protein